MKLFLFASFLFVCVHTIFGHLYDDSNNLYFSTYNFTNKCSAPGLMCRTCEELVRCIEISPGEFTKIPIQTCNKTSTCLKDHCTEESNPLCLPTSTTNFICRNTGLFPDPFNCKRYHSCIMSNDTVSGNIKTEHIELKCQDSFGYDPVTTYCKNKLVNGNCPATLPVPECKSLGADGPIPGTSIYYICLPASSTNPDLIPNLYMCPHGTKYGNGKCT